MVLNNNSNQEGVTLLELIVGITLSMAAAALAYMLFVNVQRQIFQKQTKSESEFNLDVVSHTLKNILMQSERILEVHEQELSIRKAGGEKIRIHLEDSILKFNETPLLNKITGLEISVFGPIITDTDNSLGNLPYQTRQLISWDSDQNEILEFEELDRDDSGILETIECDYIGLITITIFRSMKGPRNSAQFSVHIRN